jgi:hypothetical protein
MTRLAIYAAWGQIDREDMITWQGIRGNWSISRKGWERIKEITPERDPPLAKPIPLDE